MPDHEVEVEQVEAAAAVAPQIVMHMGIQLHIDPLQVPEDPRMKGQIWTEWIEEFEEECKLQKIKDEDWPLCLRRYIGKEGRHLLKNLQEPPPLPDDPDRPVETEYQKLKRKLEADFLSHKNKYHGRSVFSKMNPKPNEAITMYAARLKDKAAYCKFDSYVGERDERILEHLLNTTDNDEINKRAISKEWTLDKYLTESATREHLNRDIKDMRSELKIAAKIKKYPRKQKHTEPLKKEESSDENCEKDEDNEEDFACPCCGQGRKSHGKSGKPKLDEKQEKKTDRYEYDCTFCGKHHAYGRCPAYGKICLKCGKKNHFAVQCGRFGKDSEKNKSVKKTNCYYEDDSEESDDSTFLHSLRG